MNTIQRRAILQSTGLLTAGLLASQITPMFAAPAGEGEAATELLRDPSFRRGFVLLRAEPGRKVECGTVRGPNADPPVWHLAQWSSRHPFDATTAVTHGDGGSLRLANPARSVGFGGDDGVLTLAVNTAVEYADRPRAGSEPWVHLLVEQPVATPPRLADLTALRLRLEARRVRARLAREDGYDPRIHAAQFQIFITVQNLEKGSPGFGNYLWFGVPVFDNRHRSCPTYAAPDFAGSGKYIYTPGSGHFTTGTTHDGGWVRFAADILPLIREGVDTARARGFLKQIDDPGLLRVAALNMGWEVPGTFDVEMQVRRLSLAATPR